MNKSTNWSGSWRIKRRQLASWWKGIGSYGNRWKKKVCRSYLISVFLLHTIHLFVHLIHVEKCLRPYQRAHILPCIHNLYIEVYVVPPFKTFWVRNIFVTRVRLTSSCTLFFIIILSLNVYNTYVTLMTTIMIKS